MGDVFEVDGNLFHLGLPALGQGVNLMGKMGLGIARDMARNYPGLLDDYRQAIREGRLTLGGAHLYTHTDGTVIVNIATQRNTGRDAREDAIETGLHSALHQLTEHGIDRLGLPRIGCGIGGLEWPHVYDIILRVTSDHPVAVTIATPPVKPR